MVEHQSQDGRWVLPLVLVVDLLLLFLRSRKLLSVLSCLSIIIAAQVITELPVDLWAIDHKSGRTACGAPKAVGISISPFTFTGLIIRWRLLDMVKQVFIEGLEFVVISKEGILPVDAGLEVDLLDQVQFCCLLSI